MTIIWLDVYAYTVSHVFIVRAVNMRLSSGFPHFAAKPLRDVQVVTELGLYADRLQQWAGKRVVCCSPVQVEVVNWIADVGFVSGVLQVLWEGDEVLRDEGID